MDIEFGKMLILQLPNFIGFVAAVYVQWRQNQALVELLRECNQMRYGDISQTVE